MDYQSIAADLLHAIKVIDDQGFGQGALTQPGGVCVIGAISQAKYGNPLHHIVNKPAPRWHEDETLRFLAHHIDQYCDLDSDEVFTTISEFNDAPTATAETVRNVLYDAATEATWKANAQERKKTLDQLTRQSIEWGTYESPVGAP